MPIPSHEYGDDIIHAESPEAGLRQLIEKKESVLTSAEVTYLNKFKRLIYSEAKDPTNITIVIYSEKDTHYDIKIGNGKERYIIDLSDCTYQSQKDLRRIKLSMIQENVPRSKADALKSIIVAGLGAVGAGGIYCAFVANPVTGPVLLLATGGAALGSAVNFLGRKNETKNEFHLECEPEDLEKVSNVVKHVGNANPIENRK